jgi:transcription initiation factor IIE alpha subunit
MTFHSDHIRARNSDPFTSHQAAESVKDSAKHHAAIVVECLRKYGAMGKDGIAEKSGLEPMQVARRLHELEREGLIQLTGQVVKSRSNRMEREWAFIAMQTNLF